MITPSTSPRRYRISVAGDCGQLLASGIAGIEIESVRDGTTTVVVGVRDDSEFYGLLDRLQDFALHVVSLTELTWHGLRSQALSPADLPPAVRSAPARGRGGRPRSCCPPPACGTRS
jgi:hypothetical protein